MQLPRRSPRIAALRASQLQLQTPTTAEAEPPSRPLATIERAETPKRGDTTPRGRGRPPLPPPVVFGVADADFGECTARIKNWKSSQPVANPSNVEWVITFDGACRKTTNAAKCSAAAFSEQSREAVAAVLPTTIVSNNAAEICGLNLALLLAQRVPPAVGVVHIRGDSLNTIAAATDGWPQCVEDGLADGTPNAQFWRAIAPKIAAIRESGRSLKFSWFSRVHNVASDHFCNRVLDGLDGCVEEKMCIPAATVVDYESLANIAAGASSPRMVQRASVDIWGTLMNALMKTYLAEPSFETLVPIWFGPRIFLSGVHHSQMRSHLASLMDQTRRQEYLANFVVPHDPPREAGQRKLSTEWARTAPSKVLNAITMETGASEPTMADIHNSWPQDTAFDPANLHIPDAPPVVIDNALLLHMLRNKVKAARSPDAGGWNKELLWPVVRHDRHTVPQLLEHVFNNNDPRIQQLITDDRGLILANEKTGKRRGVAVSSLFALLVWRCQLARTSISYHDGEVPARQAAVIVSELVARGPVVKTDAVNAFHTMARAAMKAELIKQKASALFQMWNIFYARATTITCWWNGRPLTATINRGVRAGCASGDRLFRLGLKATLAKINSLGFRTLSVVDDVYVTAPMSQQLLDTVTVQFATVGLAVHPTKTTTVENGQIILGTRLSKGIPTAVDDVWTHVAPSVERLVLAPIPFHAKWFLYRSIMAKVEHFIATINATNTDELIAAISAKAIQTLADVMRIPRAAISLCLSQSTFRHGGIELGWEPFIPASLPANAVIRNPCPDLVRTAHFSIGNIANEYANTPCTPL